MVMTKWCPRKLSGLSNRVVMGNVKALCMTPVVQHAFRLREYIIVIAALIYEDVANMYITVQHTTFLICLLMSYRQKEINNRNFQVLETSPFTQHKRAIANSLRLLNSMMSLVFDPFICRWR